MIFIWGDSMVFFLPLAMGLSMAGLSKVAYSEGKKEYFNNFTDEVEDQLVRLSSEVTEIPPKSNITNIDIIEGDSPEMKFKFVNEKGEEQETFIPVKSEVSTDIVKEYETAFDGEGEISFKGKTHKVGNSRNSSGDVKKAINIKIDNPTKETADTVSSDFIVDPRRTPTSLEVATATQRGFLDFMRNYESKFMQASALNPSLKLSYDYGIRQKDNGEYYFHSEGGIYKIDIETGKETKIQDLPYIPPNGSVQEDLVVSKSNISARIANPDLYIKNPTVGIAPGSQVGIQPGETVGITSGSKVGLDSDAAVKVKPGGVVGVSGDVGIKDDAVVGVDPEGLSVGVKGITNALENKNKYDYTGELKPSETSVKGKEVAVNDSRLEVEFSNEDNGTYTDSEGYTYALKKGYKRNIAISKVAEKTIEQHKDVLGENQSNIDLADTYEFEQQKIDAKENIENTSVEDTVIPEELDDYKVHRDIGAQFFNTEESKVPDVPIEK